MMIPLNLSTHATTLIPQSPIPPKFIYDENLLRLGIHNIYIYIYIYIIVNSILTRISFKRKLQISYKNSYLQYGLCEQSHHEPPNS